MKRLLPLALVFVIAGCRVVADGKAAVVSQAPGDPLTLSGSVFVPSAGQSLLFSAIWDASGSASVLVLSADPKLCEELANAQNLSNQIVVQLGTVDASGKLKPATGPGTFPLRQPSNGQWTAGPVAIAMEEETSSGYECGGSGFVIQGGQVVIETWTDATIAGTFDLLDATTFVGGDGTPHLVGTFDAAQCTAVGDRC